MGFVRRLLKTLARPARARGLVGGVRLQAFRGCGSKERAFVMGRVTREPGFGLGARKDPLRRDVLDVLRRFLRHGIRDALVEAQLGEVEASVRTDRDGYFELDIRLDGVPPGDGLWRTATLRHATADGKAATTTVDVLFPSEAARFLVISDIDDTVMHTGVANKAMMMWRLFAEGARSRIAFPGVAAFYRALHEGPLGGMANPVVYVSRAPWSIYEVLDAFFQRHRIPIGPVLFLREWGLTLQRPLPRRARDHKRDIILHMLELYPGLPAVLIGDSGQHDPETYRQVALEKPGRIAAVYIRDVMADATRNRKVRKLASELEQEGAALTLADDTLAMARDAVERGLIAPEALDAIARERAADAAAGSD